MLYVQKSKSFLRLVLNHFSHLYHNTKYGSCAVLLYHRISEYSTDPQLLCVTPQNFNTHLAFLKNNYNLLRIDEWVSHLLNKRKFPERSVVLTFDDGYVDNYLFALPLLEQYKVQALFYIATGTIDSDREFWWDEVERAVLLPDNLNELNISFNQKIIKYNPDKDNRKDFYNSLLATLRVLAPAERDEVISKLLKSSNANSSRTSHRAMTWKEVKLMSDSDSAVIGAHTVNHPSLANLNKNDQQFEIETSKKVLKEKIQKEVIHFSYPFGTHSDFNYDSLEICKSNFKIVSANYPALCYANSDSYQLPRFLVRDWNEMEFSANLLKFFRL